MKRILWMVTVLITLVALPFPVGAAQLAAYYSETSGGQNIPVDVTPVKQVKKIPNGKPGMVIYHTYKTVIANPYADIVVDALNAEKKEET